MRKKVAIIMGGYSSEYNISLKSGNVVYQHLSKEKYDCYKVHIFRNKWVLVDDFSNEYSIDKDDFSVKIDDTKIIFDVVFNAIHGNPGENGLMSAYFDLLKIPHTSAPFYQMALTFNKRDCLSVLKNAGIKAANSIYYNNGDLINEDFIIEKLGLPCFVKPNNSGSSFGISKVDTKDELLPAIKKAYQEDTEILIESFLDGTEVSVGVIEYNGEVKVLPITEIISENNFFDYDAKYNGKSQEITPARLPDSLCKKVEANALKVYNTLKMKGFSRAEYIIVGGEPYFIEINTVPGLTAESILPQQASCVGITLQNLFHNAIEMALKS